MPIRITCPDCCTEPSFPDEAAGRRVLCPRCHAVLVAPGRAGPRPAENSRGPVREEAVRATRPAKAVAEPARPKQPAGATEGRVRAKRPADSEGRLRTTRTAEADAAPEPEEAGPEDAGPEPRVKKKRKPKGKPQRQGSSLVWWLVGAAGGFVVLVAALVIVVVLNLKPGAPRAPKAQPPAEPEGEWVDVKTATQLGGKNLELSANIMQIYAMGGECKFAKGGDRPLVALRLSSCPHVSDSFLIVVRGMAVPTLKYLDLSYTRITDDGANQLVGLKQLDVLNIERTNVSILGYGQLKQFMPNTKIIWQ